MGGRFRDELIGIDLGDRRLNERSLKLIEPLGANPEASVNAALQGWGDTAAAYRFFDNPKVTPEEILRPHRTATLERMRQESVALVLQDTTELDLTDHPPDDARCLNKPERFGLYDHTHLAVTPGRVSLGVVGMKLFDRDPETLGQTAERSSWPIEEKESFRWLQGYRLACDLQQQCPDTQVVSVADREGDLYEIFVAAAEHQSPADFLIRSKESRCTPERDPASGAAAYRKMRDEVSESVLRYRKTLDLPATPKRAARPAEIEVRARTVTLKPPHARGQLPSVTINVIQAVEVNGPGDGTDVEWWLLTSLPIETFEELERALDD